MILISNLYSMLAYAYEPLRARGYKSLEEERFESAEELFSEILIRGVTLEIKHGLKRDYVQNSEELAAIRGRINLSESARRMSAMRGKIVCAFDHYSQDCRENRILKAALRYLAGCPEVSDGRKTRLKQLLPYFALTGECELRKTDWTRGFQERSQHLCMLLEICSMIAKRMLATHDGTKSKMLDFDTDDQKTMSHLYEKFLLGFYRRHYPELNAEASYIPWAQDGDFGYPDPKSLLPAMKTDVTLEFGGRILIIDAKYYDSVLVSHFAQERLRSAHLYQIFTYVKNLEAKLARSGVRHPEVSGMLLYAKTDEALSPDSDYRISGNRFSVRTLDLSGPFSRILKVLEGIAHEFLLNGSKGAGMVTAA